MPVRWLFRLNVFKYMLACNAEIRRTFAFVGVACEFESYRWVASNMAPELAATRVAITEGYCGVLSVGLSVCPNSERTLAKLWILASCDCLS